MTATDYITVKQLRSKLEDLPGGLPVIVAKDGEGNSFSMLSSAVVDHYIEEDGEGHVPHPDDIDEHYPDAEPAVILWPVN